MGLYWEAQTFTLVPKYVKVREEVDLKEQPDIE